MDDVVTTGFADGESLRYMFLDGNIGAVLGVDGRVNDTEAADAYFFFDGEVAYLSTGRGSRSS